MPTSDGHTTIALLVAEVSAEQIFHPEPSAHTTLRRLVALTVS